MTALAAGALALLVLAAAGAGASRLIRKGFADGDRLEDPRTHVDLLGADRASVRVDNWSPTPVDVDLWSTSRPLDRLTGAVAAPLIKSTAEPGPRPEGATPLGQVDGGGERIWTVTVPPGVTRLVLRLSTAGRVRVHRHVLTALPGWAGGRPAPGPTPARARG